MAALVASIALHAAAIALLPEKRAPVEPLTEVRVLEVEMKPAPPEPTAAPPPVVQEPAAHERARRDKPPRTKEPAKRVQTPPSAPQRKPLVVMSSPASEVPAAAPSATPDASSAAPAETASTTAESKASGPAPPTASAGRESGAATPPRIVRKDEPRYPLSARRSGIEGTVRVKVLVTREGRPGSIQLERSSGSAALDDAAVEAVRTWQFAPARRGGEPVESWVIVPVVFRLSS